MAMQDTLDQLQNFDINDLDFNNIGSWPGPVKVILMILIVVGLGFGTMMFFLQHIQPMLLCMFKVIIIKILFS